MAEGVNRALGIGQIGRVGGEQDAGRADRDEGAAVGDRTHAAGRRRVVASSAGNGDAFLHAPFGREFGAQRSRRLGSFDQARHLSGVHAGGVQQLGRPCARAGVEPGRAGGVRHFRDVLAGQPQPEIVLREQHLADLAESLRLVVGDPDELRRREARKHDVAADRAEPRIGIEFGRLAVAAGVVPQDAGAKHRVGGVEQRRAVHLAGEPDAADRRELAGMGRPETGDGFTRGADPCRRILFRPAGMRPLDIERPRRGADDLLVVVDQQRLDPGRAEVEPKIHDVSSAGRSCGVPTCRRLTERLFFSSLERNNGIPVPCRTFPFVRRVSARCFPG